MKKCLFISTVDLSMVSYVVTSVIPYELLGYLPEARCVWMFSCSAFSPYSVTDLIPDRNTVHTARCVMRK